MRYQSRPLEALAGLVPGLTTRCPQGHQLECGERGAGSQGSVSTTLAQGALMKDLTPRGGGSNQALALGNTEPKAGRWGQGRPESILLPGTASISALSVPTIPTIPT